MQKIVDITIITISVLLTVIVLYLVYKVITITPPQNTSTSLTDQQVSEFHCLAKFHKFNRSSSIVYNYPESPYFYYAGKKINFKVKGVCEDE